MSEPHDTRKNPYEGGTLTDFAVCGTTMPNESSTEYVPSCPSPKVEHVYEQVLGYQDLAGAADNSKPQPKCPDPGEYDPMTGEVVTGTGDAMPVESEMKFAGGRTWGGKEKEERIRKGRMMHKKEWEEKRSLQACTKPGEKEHSWGIKENE
ncbi:hypothetical protein L211DRAFT_296656 [Terfezia boudieri ATCC MYA-4762]|uniref:Uncharacterized protein n=1 Tax=Terfezia boudieri ATCC MYA-4762 TaxID=1051890 RepID=A0A3N4LNK3_9PEZI|nr:hypothetical protein L211DRAFT_296656 [Terfezia boudieri ATCC MYA-4762]